MSNLTFIERKKLEDLFRMAGGYVLDFTDFTFQQFMVEAARVDIDDQKYYENGTSKAKRLRAFWKIEPNHVVANSIDAMIELATMSNHAVDTNDIDECKAIAQRLLDESPVPEIDAIKAVSDDRAFEALAESVRESVEKHKTEEGLDRLHTFLIKYIRKLCVEAGIDANPKKALHAVFGEYVKHLRSEGLIESDMAERILKSTISIFESFNHVRNNRSFAHDNQLLTYHESLLIFNNVCAAVKFLRAITDSAQRKEAEPVAAELIPPTDDIPF